MVAETVPARLVYFKLFDNCNAKCNMCECWQVPRSKPGLAHYKTMLHQVLSARPDGIRFTGGEPLLFRELPELIRMVRSAGCRVTVISNGRLLAGKVATLREAGCDEIVLSVDGLQGTHDRVRATPRLFSRCVKAMAEMAEHDLPYGVNTVLQRLSIRDMTDLGTLLMSRDRRPDWWHLIPVRDDDDLRPTAEQIEWFRQELPLLERRAADAGIQIIADVDMFAPRLPQPCAVPSFATYVDGESGSVFACNMLAYADRPLGNLRTAPLDEIYRQDVATAAVRSCAGGTHLSCGRCDASSARMNGVLRERALLPMI